MYSFVPLVREYRGALCDLTHFGYVCIVNEDGEVIFFAGDPEAVVFYRSASKPVQALPVMEMRLDEKYGITPKESVIFSGSHTGEPFHMEALESILKKTGLEEEWLCMKPAAPAAVYANEERSRKGLPLRKLYHNCSGKHLALMLVQRESKERVTDYWRMESAAQKKAAEVIRKVSEAKELQTGVDGCGVPVFACAMRNIATAYKNLACPDCVRDESLQRAIRAYVPRIHEYPLMMRGTGYLCSLINYDADIIGKGGANGVYGFGLKKERLGVSFKLADGTESSWPILVLEILSKLGCLTKETEERLLALNPYVIKNDNGLDAGHREVCLWQN